MFKEVSALLAGLSKAIARAVSETPCLLLCNLGSGVSYEEDSSLAGKGFTLGNKPAFRSKKTRSRQGKRIVSPKWCCSFFLIILFILPRKKGKETMLTIVTMGWWKHGCLLFHFLYLYFVYLYLSYRNMLIFLCFQVFKNNKHGWCCDIRISHMLHPYSRGAYVHVKNGGEQVTRESHRLGLNMTFLSCFLTLEMVANHLVSIFPIWPFILILALHNEVEMWSGSAHGPCPVFWGLCASLGAGEAGRQMAWGSRQGAVVSEAWLSSHWLQCVGKVTWCFALQFLTCTTWREK